MRQSSQLGVYYDDGLSGSEGLSEQLRYEPSWLTWMGQDQ